MFGSLLKAAVGVVVELPVAVAADIVTLGGAMSDKDKPYTAEAVSKIVGNIQDATEQESDK